EDRLMVGVKLPDAADFALTFPFAEPTGYGMGRAGWVRCTFHHGDEPPVGILEDWIEESYRAVAPKKLVKQLDATGDDMPPSGGAPGRDDARSLTHLSPTKSSARASSTG